jgi:hypothetical protein
MSRVSLARAPLPRLFLPKKRKLNLIIFLRNNHTFFITVVVTLLNHGHHDSARSRTTKLTLYCKLNPPSLLCRPSNDDIICDRPCTVAASPGSYIVQADDIYSYIS